MPLEIDVDCVDFDTLVRVRVDDYAMVYRLARPTREGAALAYQIGRMFREILRVHPINAEYTAKGNRKPIPLRK